jgi:hypothetical protein
MKEPILDYLETADPENISESIEKFEYDAGIDLKKLSLDRNRTMKEWKSESKDIITNKFEKHSQ